jgi:carbonic anhydrase
MRRSFWFARPGRINGWVYKIETGKVFAYDLASGQFVPLAEYRFPASEASVRLRTTAEI